MLTFFEYLRQRAFESVLTGAQDALDVLERQKTRGQPQKQIPQPTEVHTADGNTDPRKKVEDKSQSEPPKADDKPIPPPRDRGRPTQEAKAKK